jgi:hypothetical protein
VVVSAVMNEDQTAALMGQVLEEAHAQNVRRPAQGGDNGQAAGAGNRELSTIIHGSLRRTAFSGHHAVLDGL